MIRKLMASTAMLALLAAGGMGAANAASHEKKAQTQQNQPAVESQTGAASQDSAMPKPADGAATAESKPATDQPATAAAPAKPAGTATAAAGKGFGEFADKPHLATIIIGQAVYSGQEPEAERIGEVNDLIISEEGAVTHAVIGVGGFLGIGEKDVAVPMEELTVVEQEGEVRFVYASTREQLEAAEKLDRTAYDPRVRSAPVQDTATAPVGGAVPPAGAPASGTAMTQPPADAEKPADTAAATPPAGAEKPADTAAATPPAGAEKPADTAAATKPADAEKPADTAAATKPADAEKPADTAAATPPADAEKPADTAAATKPADAEKPADTAAATPPAGAEKPADTAAATGTTTTTTTAEQKPADTAAATGTTTTATATSQTAFVDWQKDGQLRASAIMGKEVYGPDDQSIGEVSDLVMQEDGETRAALIDVGGFLGVGEKEVAIPFEEIEVMQEGDEMRLKVAMTKEQLEQAPAYERQTAAAPAAGGEQPAAGAQPPAEGQQAATTTTTGQQTAAAPAAGEATFTPQAVSADELIGSRVVGAGNDDIGEIDDVVFTAAGDIQAVVVDVGGFLGMGEKPVAIQYDTLNVEKEDDGDLVVMMNATEEQLKQAPAYQEAQ